MDRARVLIRGAGEMASAVAWKLNQVGAHVAMTEVAYPLAIRRAVCFSEAIFQTEAAIEGVRARLTAGAAGVLDRWHNGEIAVVIDPELTVASKLEFDALVEATLSKTKSPSVDRSRAKTVIALGPGYSAPEDVHFVIETHRGHDLGRVIRHGCAEPDTRIPGSIEGYTHERVLRAPADGRFEALYMIGDPVEPDDVVARVDGHEMKAQIPGVLRGILRTPSIVAKGQKAGDIDPRGKPEYCFTLSDKARAVAGGVLEALVAGGSMLVVRFH